MLTFGIVGTGRISDWVLAGALQDERIRIGAVCSRTYEAAANFISRNSLGDVRVYLSIDDLVKDSEIDAVYIGTPNQTHCSYSVKCLCAGKHVLCEKPLAVSAEEGRLMVETARRNGCLLMEAMISTLNPNFRAASQKISEIIPIRQYSSCFCQYSTRYEALKQGIVASSFKPKTAGALRDIGIYTLYPLVCLFGRPSDVHSQIRTYMTPEGLTDVHGTLVLDYDGMDAVLTYSKICDSFQPTEISGENGNIIIDEIHIARKTEFVMHAPPASGQGPKPQRTILSEGLPKNEYYYEFKEFADILDDGRTESEINSHKTSLTVLEIIDKALNS